MLNLNFALVILVILISFFNYSLVKADVQECNKIPSDGGQQNLKILSNEVTEKIYNCKGNDLQYFDQRVDLMSRQCFNRVLQNDCASATECTKRSGIYKIKVDEINEPFLVVCDAETKNGDWLVIQRRQDGSMDFYRDWVEYENGFGDIEGEFFIGLKKLYALTNYHGPQELLIVMEDGNSTTAYAKYDSFAIANCTESYKLKRIGKYSGTAGNSLKHHIGMKFTTKDHDNDLRPNEYCAVMFTGAWWYTNCHHSNLKASHRPCDCWYNMIKLCIRL